MRREERGGGFLWFKACLCSHNLPLSSHHWYNKDSTEPERCPTWHALLGNLTVIDLLFKGEISYKAIDVTGLFLAITVYPTYCLGIMARVPGSIKHHHSVGTDQIHTQAPGPLKHKPTTTELLALKTVFKLVSLCDSCPSIISFVLSTKYWRILLPCWWTVHSSSTEKYVLKSQHRSVYQLRKKTHSPLFCNW